METERLASTLAPLLQATKVAHRTNACPRCQSTSCQRIPYAPILAENSLYVAECARCQLRFTVPTVIDDWSEFYGDHYAPYRKRLKQHRKEARARWLSDKLGPWLAGRLAPTRFPLPFGNGRALEIGCGAGSDLRRMVDLGWEVTGLEPSSSAAEKASRWSGASVLVDFFPSSRLSHRSFQLIVAQQVIEHLDSLDTMGAEIARLLAPGGRLFISVPNCDSWSARQFGPGWIGWDLPRHRTHFTRQTLARWAQEAGLVVDSVKTQSHAHWISQSASQTKAPKKPSIFARRTWASLANRYTAWTDQGDSLLLWARKPAIVEETV